MTTLRWEAPRINNNISHDIYFTYKSADGNNLKSLILQGDKDECIEKANAWLQWEVSPVTTIHGEWEETDYLTFHYREVVQG